MDARHATCLVILTACGSKTTGSSDFWTFSTDKMSVEIDRKPFAYTVRDAAGKTVLSSIGNGKADGYGALGWTSGSFAIVTTISPGYFGVDQKLDPWRDDWEVTRTELTGTTFLVDLARGELDRAHVTFTARDRALRVEAKADGAAPRAWEAAFSTPADEGFLGLGERFTRTNFRGLAMYSWAEEGGIGSREGDTPGPHNPYPNGEAMSYYPVPFFVSTKGYGFWLDSTWWNEYDFAIDRPDAWRIWAVGPTLAFEVYLGQPYDVIDQFTERTGRPMQPPAWAFGPRRRFGYGDQVGGVSELQKMRDDDLAVTAIDDNLHFLPSGATADEVARLGSAIPEARRLGYRSTAYFNAFFSTDPAAPIAGDVQVGLRDGYFIHDDQGKPAEVFLISGSVLLNLYILDFSSPEATAWYVRHFDQALALGESGWMYDFGEYIPAGAVTASGMTGYEFHNLFPVLYQKAAHDYLEQSPVKGDWLLYARSGYTGASQYMPMVWSGDPAASFDSADGLPSMVRGGINMGISGVPIWGGDIGGYHCLSDGAQAADGELLARWIEQGALTPNMHDENACAGGNGDKASIWTSADAHQAWQTYARLHTRLLPYFVALAAEAHATGKPLIRHVFLEHPDHPEWAGVDDVYYLGPALLVAPVVARGARDKMLSLPAGRWLDWQAQTLVEGGGRVSLDAPLAKLPLLLRDGYLVPLLDAAIDTLDDRETNPSVVGPGDVADVYDVVGLISTGKSAAFGLGDGKALAAGRAGAFAAPPLPMAAGDDELATCAGCWLATPLAGGLTRVRISATGDVTAGGLTLHSTATRRIRWDLYLAD